MGLDEGVIKPRPRGEVTDPVLFCHSGPSFWYPFLVWSGGGLYRVFPTNTLGRDKLYQLVFEKKRKPNQNKTTSLGSRHVRQILHHSVSTPDLDESSGSSVVNKGKRCFSDSEPVSLLPWTDPSVSLRDRPDLSLGRGTVVRNLSVTT